jgi:hypothetical protein
VSVHGQLVVASCLWLGRTVSRLAGRLGRAGLPSRPGSGRGSPGSGSLQITQDAHRMRPFGRAHPWPAHLLRPAPRVPFTTPIILLVAA